MSDELMCFIMQIRVVWHGGAVGIQMEDLDCASVNSQLKLFSEHVILVFVTQKHYQHTMDHARIKLQAALSFKYLQGLWLSQLPEQPV